METLLLLLVLAATASAQTPDPAPDGNALFQRTCVQCHMGSPSSSFILGFTPVQINRKPYVGEPDMFAPADKLLGYGVLEDYAPGPDELTQLRRLIDYGIITGISSPSDVKSLKEVEAVPPRKLLNARVVKPPFVRFGQVLVR